MFRTVQFPSEAPHTELFIRRSGERSTPKKRAPPHRLWPCLTAGGLRFVVPPMNISDAIHLERETCALRQFSIKTEKTYGCWLGCCAAFLRCVNLRSWRSPRRGDPTFSPRALIKKSVRTPSDFMLFAFPGAPKLCEGGCFQLFPHQPSTIHHQPLRGICWRRPVPP